ncbi:MAG: hypothetical protein WBD20_10860, partial [Pirellulaceae bacterium]
MRFSIFFTSLLMIPTVAQAQYMEQGCYYKLPPAQQGCNPDGYPYDFSQPDCGDPVQAANQENAYADGWECTRSWWAKQGGAWNYQNFTGFGYHATQESRFAAFPEEENSFQGFLICMEEGGCEHHYRETTLSTLNECREVLQWTWEEYNVTGIFGLVCDPAEQDQYGSHMNGPYDGTMNGAPDGQGESSGDASSDQENSDPNAGENDQLGTDLDEEIEDDDFEDGSYEDYDYEEDVSDIDDGADFYGDDYYGSDDGDGCYSGSPC